MRVATLFAVLALAIAGAYACSTLTKGLCYAGEAVDMLKCFASQNYNNNTDIANLDVKLIPCACQHFLIGCFETDCGLTDADTTALKSDCAAATCTTAQCTGAAASTVVSVVAIVASAFVATFFAL